MEKISPEQFLIFAPVLAFLAASAVWLLTLTQNITFIEGLLIVDLFLFLIFRKGLLINRRAGRLFGLKSRKKIFAVSLVAALAFGEIFWVISFLPFSFAVSSGLLTIFFAFSFDSINEWFKIDRDLFFEAGDKKFKSRLARNVIMGAIFILILILTSPWLPPKTF